MELKTKLIKLTEGYKTLFPEDYQATCQYIRQERNKTSQFNVYGELKGADYIDKRSVEFPEKLYTVLIEKLNAEEFKELFEAKDHKTIRWFAKQYPEFLITK